MLFQNPRNLARYTVSLPFEFLFKFIILLKGFLERNHEWLHTSKFSAWCSIHLWEWQEPHGLEDNLVVPSIIFYSPWHCLVCWGSMFCPFEGYESLLMNNKNRPMSIGRRIPFWPLSRLQECQYQTLIFLPLQSAGKDLSKRFFMYLLSFFKISNEAGASIAWYQHCRKWMFWVRNLHPEKDVYGNVDIML